jgi:hypothetical protein
MPINLTRSCGAVLIALSVGVAANAQNPRRTGIKFEVLSVERLSDKEAADRSPDFIGPNIAVRLRLSTEEHGLASMVGPTGSYQVAIRSN